MITETISNLSLHIYTKHTKYSAYIQTTLTRSFFASDSLYHLHLFTRQFYLHRISFIINIIIIIVDVINISSNSKQYQLPQQHHHQHIRRNDIKPTQKASKYNNIHSLIHTHTHQFYTFINVIRCCSQDYSRINQYSTVIDD